MIGRKAPSGARLSGGSRSKQGWGVSGLAPSEGGGVSSLEHGGVPRPPLWVAVKCFPCNGCGKRAQGLVVIWLSSLKLPFIFVHTTGSLAFGFARLPPPLVSQPPTILALPSSPLPLLTKVNIGFVPVPVAFGGHLVCLLHHPFISK